MPEFLIEAVEQGQPWNHATGGPMQAWKVNVNDGTKSFAAEISTKAGKPGPTVGERIEATIKHTEYGAKLKKVFSNNGGGGGGRAPMSPEKEAEITRMHSQEMAIRWADVLQASGQWPTDASPEQRRATLVSLIDFFQADAASTKGAS